jgi:ABC-type proline/glycine betaine transport system ATPase subunit
VADPDFAVLDSIDDGVDPVRLAGLCRLIVRHHELGGGAYVVTTHDMVVAQAIADHVVILGEGRTVLEGPADEVFGSARADVRQFLEGAEEGPLALHSDPVRAEDAYMPPPPGEYDMHSPLPLVAVAMLGIMTASVLALVASRSVAEIAIVIVAWLAIAALVAVRHGSRRR